MLGVSASQGSDPHLALSLKPAKVSTAAGHLGGAWTSLQNPCPRVDGKASDTEQTFLPALPGRWGALEKSGRRRLGF